MKFLDHLRRLVDAVLASHYPEKWKPKRYNIRPLTSLHTTYTKIVLESVYIEVGDPK